MIYKLKKNINEICFAFYFFMFTLLKPISQSIGNSTLFLFIVTLIVVLISMGTRLKITKADTLYILTIFIVLILAILNFNMSYSSKYSQYLYEFAIYGIIPVFLLLRCKNTELIIKLLFWLGLLNIILNIWDPLRGYILFANQMDYGFSLMLPSYICIAVGNKIYKSKIVKVIEYICIFMMLVFANRSVYLSIALFVTLSSIYDYKESRDSKKLFRIILILIALLVVVINFKSIVSYAYGIAVSKGYFSYSLRHLMYMVQGDTDQFFSGRLELWGQGLSDFIHSPIIGNGLGYFESKMNGYYAHNIIVDILCSFGIIGFTFFSYIVFSSIFRIHKTGGVTKLLGLIFVCIAFPKLFFSIYIWKEPCFWLTIAYSYMIQNNRIEETSKALPDLG